MQRVGEHPVPAGPLAVRWLAYELPALRAGRVDPARIVVANAGTVAWPALSVSYHWLDRLGNAIVWEGLRTPIEPLAPGAELDVEAYVRGAMPPGRYRLAFDLVVEARYWLSELGNHTLDLEVDVAPRIGRALAMRGAEPPQGQDEPLVPEEEAEAIVRLAPGWQPATPAWSRLILDAHQEGYALVGGAVEARDRELRPWTVDSGRLPSFAHPLLFPSLVVGVDPPEWLEVAGLPAAAQLIHDPWIFDGRITARPRSGRRRG